MAASRGRTHSDTTYINLRPSTTISWKVEGVGVHQLHNQDCTPSKGTMRDMRDDQGLVAQPNMHPANVGIDQLAGPNRNGAYHAYMCKHVIYNLYTNATNVQLHVHVCLCGLCVCV